MTALASLAPWAVIALVALVLIFVLALVSLVLTKKRPGDQIIVQVFPPKIEIRSDVNAKPQIPQGQSEIAPSKITESTQSQG